MKNTATTALLVGVLAVFAVSAALAQDDSAAKLFEPTWQSLERYECPEWFRDAKFGIYAHWGPFAVPAHRSEWYSHYMYFNYRKRQEEVYVICLDLPKSGRVAVKSLGTDAGLLQKTPARVTMPGSNATIEWTRDSKAMTFTLPTKLPCEHVYVFRLDLK